LTTKSISRPWKPEIHKREGSDEPKIVYEQSGVVDDVGTTTRMAMVSFHDSEPGHNTSVTSIDDPTRSITDDPSVEFRDFFKRPVLLQEVNVAVGVDNNFLFYPWRDWMQNVRISNRLNNFRNFRGRLPLKFILYGNPFYWGSIMTSYYPMTSNSLGDSNDALHYTDPSHFGDVMRASQRPHVLLDPSTSKGAEMVLPFLWDADCFDLVSGDPVELGQLWTYTLSTVRSALGTDNIKLLIYAWAEDVHLSVPTVSNMSGLLPQAGEVNDEHANGPISKPAAIVSEMAGAAAMAAPSIAEYALPVSQAAAAVSKAAKAAGFCKPTEVSDKKRVVINNSSDLATTDALDTCAPLSFNVKHEVSPDPRISGLDGTDELAFNNLSKIESVLTRTNWIPGNARYFRIASIPITPMLCLAEAWTIPNVANAVQLTPSGFVALPFRYWKGTARLRVQIVASGFHKGRLLVEWDPVSSVVTPETQVQYSKIIDIATERDFSIDIGWGSQYAALETGGFPTATQYTAGGFTPTVNPLQHNGVVTIRVLNELVAPSGSTDPVQVLTWISFPDL